MFYLVNALDYFHDKDIRRIQHATYEIGMLGRNGLDINNPETIYTLESMPGSLQALPIASKTFHPAASTSPPTP